MKIIALPLALTLMLAGCAATPPPIANQPAAYMALGTEPFWNLEITPERLNFRGVDIPVILIRNPGERRRGATRRYQTARLTISIRNETCSDGMSENSYSDSVEVVADGRRFQGCGGSVTNDLYPSALERSSWRITHINGAAVLADVEADLSFAEGRVSGSAGCNRLNGSYTHNRADLSFGPLAMTRMACSGRRGEQEAAVAALMSQPLTIRFGERMTMTWTTADGRTLALRRLDWD
jgi:heat shock protein HslJ